jgi:hypothetical protein
MQSSYWTPRARTLLVMALMVAGVTYPPTADALLTQEKKFIEPQPVHLGYFGGVVGVSDDGNTALVMSHSECWTAYIFVRAGNTWSLQQTLVTPATPGCYEDSRSAAALSGDGNTVLIANHGLQAAWVFVRSGSTWTLQQQFTPSTAEQDIAFGAYNAALSDDGSTALVGAPWEACCGAAYVFVRSGGTWTQQQRLTVPDTGPNDGFAYRVALAGDGQSALINAYLKDCPAGPACGAAYLFVRSGNTWVQQQKLTPADAAAYDTFGFSVALSGDGKTALVGAIGADCLGSSWCGAAYLFVRSGNTWVQQQKLTATNVAFPWAEFGSAVTLSGDGKTALIGAAEHDCWGGQYCGSAYVFVPTGGSWIQQQKLTGADTVAGNFFAYDSMAISGDGGTALVGAWGDGCPAGSLCGAAYVFVDKCKRKPETPIIDPDCIDLVQPPFKNWILVGCEIVDCCPFCPGPLIDWTIRVDGDPIDALILRFENLHPAMVRQLRIEGNAEWLKGNRLQIKGQGEITIRGFSPVDNRDLRWSLLSPRMALDGIVAREGVARLGGQAGAPIQRTGTVRVRVEQKVGSVTINNSSLVYRYR